MSLKNKLELIYFGSYDDERGKLCFIEQFKDTPFNIKRVYYMYDVPTKITRGAHAHKRISQILVAINGSFTIELTDGREKVIYQLNNPKEGLLIPPGIWSNIYDFSKASTCMVLASDFYDEKEYIRDYEEFLREYRD